MVESLAIATTTTVVIMVDKVFMVEEEASINSMIVGIGLIPL